LTRRSEDLLAKLDRALNAFAESVVLGGPLPEAETLRLLERLNPIEMVANSSTSLRRQPSIPPLNERITTKKKER
jgi:hypothetical protein